MLAKMQATGMKALYLAAIMALIMASFAADTYAQYNGECWAADYYSVFKIESNGQATQISGFSQPLSLSINPKDGSCWVADTDAIKVRKLSAAGQELAVIDGVATPKAFAVTAEALTNPASVSVDPRDGSCWVATLNTVCKFSPDAKQTFIKDGFNEPLVAVNPKNGDVWIADSSNARVVRLSEKGNQLAVIAVEGITQPKSISVNPIDGSCWILDPFTHKIAKLSADGKILVQTTPAVASTSIMSTSLVASLDGGCWMAVMFDMMNDAVFKLDATGKQVLKVEGFAMPSGLAVDPKDGGCWVADTNNGQILKITSGGQKVSNISELTQPKVLAVGYKEK